MWCARPAHTYGWGNVAVEGSKTRLASRITTDASAVTDVSSREPVIRSIELTPLQSAAPLLVSSSDNMSISEELPAWRRHFLFLVVVVLPVLLSILYFGLIESDMYVSHAQFFVRRVNNSAAQNLTSVMTSPLVSRIPDETYAVSAYLTSRDAVGQLDKNGAVRRALRSSKADFINRFPNFYSEDTEEALYKHFKRFVDVSVDGSTGIISLEVIAFDPHTAQNLADQLLVHAEHLINRLNERALLDAVEYAQSVVSEAEARLDRVSASLLEFRNNQKVIDPDQEATAILNRVANMSSELAKLEAKLAEQVRLAPASPAIKPLKAKIHSYEAELHSLRQKAVGPGGSMSSKMERFSQLVLQQGFAAKSLESALLGLDKAKSDAGQKRIYLERVVSPNLPDEPTLPRRMLYIFAVLALQLFIFWIVRAFVQNAREHAQ